jgi:3-phenylpropionate/cinnamic acid dioxygenase small subunit
VTDELNEQQAVVDVLVRCAAAFDARDWPSLDSVFTADVDAYGAQGREAVVTTIRSFLGGCGPSQHLLGNYDVTVSGDSARSVCKARVLHVGAGDRADRTYECCGNYHDELVRTPEGWRLRRRNFEVTISLGDMSVLQPG